MSEALALDILGSHLNKENLFLFNPFYLTCKSLYKKTLQSNLINLFCSFSPHLCPAVSLIKENYQKIDSWIPYVAVSSVCVLGRSGCFDGQVELNNSCAIGDIADVSGYFLGLLSANINFLSLEIFPAKAFKSGRKQHINLGYGKRIELDQTNIVDLRRKENNIIPALIRQTPPVVASFQPGEVAWNRR